MHTTCKGTDKFSALFVNKIHNCVIGDFRWHTLCNIFIDTAVSNGIQQDLVICLCNIVLAIVDETLQSQPHLLRITLFGQVIHRTVEVLSGFGTPLVLISFIVG